MSLNKATEQFYEKLSERLKEIGFTTRISEDGLLEVTAERCAAERQLIAP